jgi:hypothetical protein
MAEKIAMIVWKAAIRSGSSGEAAKRWAICA